MGPWFYLDYSDGFVRRGLPGELLRLIWGPSPVSVEVVGWAISFVAVAAMIFIALRIGSLSERPGAGLDLRPRSYCHLGITTIIRGPGRGLHQDDCHGSNAVGRNDKTTVTGCRSQCCGARHGDCRGIAGVPDSLSRACCRVTPLRHRPCASPIRTPDSLSTAKLISFALLPAISADCRECGRKPSSAYLQNLDSRSTFADRAQRRLGAWTKPWRCHGMGVFETRGFGAIIATASIWGFVYLVAVIAIRIVVGRLGTWYWMSATYFALWRQ